MNCPYFVIHTNLDSNAISWFHSNNRCRKLVSSKLKLSEHLAAATGELGTQTLRGSYHHESLGDIFGTALLGANERKICKARHCFSS
jgi:hypothetical protein